MIRILTGAVAALSLLASPAIAQSQQEVLDARHYRALAAGYKALFMCSAIAHAEAGGVSRSAESVERWELAGIQSPLDRIIAELPYAIVRAPDGVVSHVSVTWDDDAPPRHARHDLGEGCKNLPMGSTEPVADRWKDIGRSHVLDLDHPLKEGPLYDTAREAFGEAYGARTRTTAVIVRAGGRNVVSEAAQEFGPLAPPQRTWSVAKSIAATLVGAAVQRGQADIHASAGLGADEDDPRRAITVDHLLRMASGRYSDTPGNRTDPLYFGGSSVEETALHWPLIHRPGTVYRYANNDTLAAIKAIEESFEEYSPAAFFDQLGMRQTVAETDWRGDYILSSQVWSTAKDLARLGQLYVDDGVLPDGTRILPEGWVQYVSSPAGPQPEGREMGYGAGFWLFNQTPGIPPDTFAAMGNRGQYVVIVPRLNVVIVRRGEDPAGTRFEILDFTRNVLATLEKEPH